MKYSKDDYRGMGKPGNSASLGPLYLIDGVMKDSDGVLIKVPNKYYANPGYNRKTRRTIDAKYRHGFGKAAYYAMVKDRKESKKKVSA